MTKWRTAALVVVVDFLVGILLMQQAIIALSTIKSQTPHITTYGQYAVVMTWPLDNNDIDLYVQDPAGHVAYFNNVSIDDMHLEHDDLALSASGYEGEKMNEERTILRGTNTGEYTANAQVYSQGSPGPVKVTISLYSLRGRDRLITRSSVILNRQGDERTAFRFTLDASGNVTGTNHLQKKLVGATVP